MLKVYNAFFYFKRKIVDFSKSLKYDIKRIRNDVKEKFLSLELLLTSIFYIKNFHLRFIKNANFSFKRKSVDS